MQFQYATNYTINITPSKCININHLIIGCEAVNYAFNDQLITIRENPFNLKGGTIVFFGVKIFFFASQRSRNVFSRQVVSTLFFFYKNNIFCPFQRQNFFLPKKPQPPPPLQIKWMFPQYMYMYTCTHKGLFTCTHFGNV